jgi:hypothetical protein
VFLLLLCNDRAVLGPWVNRRGTNLFTSAVVAVLVTLASRQLMVWSGVVGRPVDGVPGDEAPLEGHFGLEGETALFHDSPRGAVPCGGGADDPMRTVLTALQRASGYRRSPACYASKFSLPAT